MEKYLKCYSLLSLTEVSLRKVAALLWSSSDILSSKSKFGSYGYHFTDIRNDWIETIEGKIKDKILKLELPESLAKQMIDIVRPMGLQIKRRMEFEKDEDLSSEYQEIMLPNSAKLCWTMAGVINYKKMAEELVRSNELPVFQRYRIACVYCLEDYIPLLWEELDERTKDYLYNEKLGDYSYSLTTYLEFCWPHIFKGELSKMNYLCRMHRYLTSLNQWAFELSVEKRYKAATEYFFHKLTPREKRISLKRTVEALVRERFRPESAFLSHFRNEILCFLLSVMTPEQQMETIKTHPIPVLLCFLDWPLQDLFLENVNHIWTILPPSCYADLLEKMADTFQRADHYFPKFFREFFMQSPQDLKIYCVHYSKDVGSPASSFFPIFFKFDDSESIKVIFRNVDAADRVKLVFDECVVGIFYEFIVNDDWPLVALCLREAGLSNNEEREKLKVPLIDYIENCAENIELEKSKLKRFFEFLEETDTNSNKKRKVQKDELENCCVE